MRPLFSHSLLTSFALYLDNQLNSDAGAQAYVNHPTGRMYWQAGQPVSGNVWASTHKSWVFDSCITGALIPTGVYNSSGQFLTRASGVVIDFQNGRIISPQNWGQLLSGVYSAKEYNIYVSTPQQVDFYLDKNFRANPDVAYAVTGTLQSRYSAPCIFITNAVESNAPWALGGEDNTENTLRCYIISANPYGQDGVNSIMRDMAHSSFSLVNYGDWPLGSSGDLKASLGGTGFCYSALCAKYGSAGIYVESVHSLRVNQRANDDSQMMISCCDVSTSVIRTPRTSH